MSRKRRNKSKSSGNISIQSNKNSRMPRAHTEHIIKGRKTKRKIKKLFDQLRNASNISINSCIDDTVIVLDDCQQTPGNKRRLSDCAISESKRIKNDNTITITDEDEALITKSEPCNTDTPKKTMNPVDCSTPIAKESTSKVLCNASENNDNTTKEINRESYLTIDLTTESDLRGNCSKSLNNTVINLADNTQDCTFVSLSNASLSISGESDVTVLEKNVKEDRKSKRKMARFANGIARLNSSEKGRLLELITQNIFNGCEVPKTKKSLDNIKKTVSRTTETAEDTYIKEVILGQTHSRNSIGSNIYNPEKDIKNKTGLRMIVIDGSNVAMEHNKGKVFSVKALKICIDYFLRRGHVVKAFVPRFRCKAGMSSDPKLLDELERRGLVVYTPSREIQGRRVCSYDDRYIVQCAAEFDGVIVSGDNYRDLLLENPRWRFVIENRVLPFTWVNDMIMFPRDPLGRNGPTLEQFLKHPDITRPIQIL